MANQQSSRKSIEPNCGPTTEFNRAVAVSFAEVPPLLACHFVHEPGPRHLPIPHDALSGNLQYFGRLLDAEPTDKSKFNYLGLAQIDQGQRLQSIIDGNNLAVASIGANLRHVV